MRWSLRGAAGLCAALWCAATTAETFTLDQAIDRALRIDPRVAESERLVDAARALVDEAQSYGDWRVDMNAFLGFSPGLKGGFFENGCLPGGCEIRDDRYEPDGLSLWGNIQFAIIKPLSTFGKVEHYTAAARAGTEVKESDVRLRRARTALDVKQAYYGYLAARDARLLLEDVKQRVDNSVKLVTEWLENGEHDVTQGDLFALQTAAGLAGRYLAQAAGLEKIALDGLKVLTGVGREEELAIADTRLDPVELPEADLAALQSRALEQRPEMAQVEAGLKARRELVEAHKSEGKPNVYAGVAGQLSYSPNRERLDNPYISDPFNDAGATPMVGIQWGWQRGIAPARAARAQAELNALLAKADLARQGIPFQVAEQYYQAQSHAAAMRALADGSRSARRWMISRLLDFEAGLEDADKVVTAFQGYVLAQTDYLKTVFDYNMYVARLAEATGAER